MNMHELPMILFTVIAQMCVGAFIVLGVAQLWLRSKTDERTTDRLTLPILLVIGPAMIAGLVVSMFHMNDVSNTLNVLRHWNSSWLSREIIFGAGFAGLGFVFAFAQWYRIGSAALRQALGILTGLVGIALVYSMSQIYYSLVTVPAWNTLIVPLHFFATTIMLGALAVGAAFVVTAMVRHHTAAKVANAPVPVPTRRVDPAGAKGKSLLRIKENVEIINSPNTDEEWSLQTKIIQALAIVSAVVGVLVLVSYPIHISNLAGGDATAQASAGVFSGGFFILRLLLLGLAAVVLAIFAYKAAGNAVKDNPTILAAIIVIAFALTFLAELMGRSLHYDSMMRIGI